jgi:O-antigen/teichoic acid export membrane protein
VRRTVGRLGWGVADQGMSSLKNFVLGVFVARSLGAMSLGALALALVTYAMVLQASRGISTDPLMVRFSGAGKDRWRRAVSSASGVALAVGILSGVACIVIGFVMMVHVTGEGGIAFVALGLGLPGLVLQDCWRYSFFACGEGGKAFTNDALWAVLLVILLPLGAPLGLDGVGWALAAFGGSASLAALWGVAQARLLPDPRGIPGWLHSHRDLGPRFLTENITLGVGQQVIAFIVAALNGLAAVGAIRGAQMLTGPVVSLLMGIAQVAVPETVRSLDGGRAALHRLCMVLSLGLGAVSLAWGIVIMAVFPFGIGEMLLGSVWSGTYALAPGVIVASTAGCLHVGPSAGLRALGRADVTLRTQLVVTGLYVGLGGLGTVAWGAMGMVWGTAAAAILGAAIWWRQLNRAKEAHFVGTDRPTPGGLEERELDERTV